jgi:CheY-like chemotaxis protein
VIARQLGHLTRLVDDLLDVSRITRGKINVNREPLELSLIVARAIETVQPMLTEKQHELVVDIGDQSWKVRGDLTRLTQVVGNVLGNAAKYTDAGGRIALIAQCDETHVEICSRDNGIGIPPDLLPSVFGLFTQLERATDRTQGGLGIGLALVRKLVEMHDGTVSAKSDGLGQGSEFIIRLPRLIEKPMSDAFDPKTLSDSPQTERTGRRILIADDNQDALESLATLLEINGHEVHTASDGALAVEVAAKIRPEVALLDIGMPKMDGYEVARRIRAEAWGKSTVLVALTGWGQDEDRRRTREAGFDSHLVKPLDLDALSEFLSRLPVDEKVPQAIY